ncbi:MAG: hypothetical protein AB7N80_10080 [Bdellovibrionales bacterium]
MQVRYFVCHNGKNEGPLAYADIEKRFNGGELYPTDHVYVAEQGDWLTMMEFIMVFGPKMKVAKDANDSQLDWRRFASGLPAPGWNDSDELAYPDLPEEAKTKKIVMPYASAKMEAEFPPPPNPPRAVLEKRVLEEMARRRQMSMQPTTPTPPLAQPPKRPMPTVAPPPPSTKPIMKVIDVSAKVEVNVLPPRATRLHIQILGEARVGEDLEIQVHALSESGSIDVDFNELVYLGCDRPLQGVTPLQFSQGQARIKVRCLTQGTHQFNLSLPADMDASREKGPLSH